jgi:acylglycerol lipase
MVPPDVARLRAEFRAPHELVRTSDGQTLFVRHWAGPGRTALALLLLHGITGYSEPYGPLLAQELASAGFEVFGLDLRGHGRSDGIRGDYPSAERLALDLGETLAVLKGRYARVVVVGHSLGVLCAVLAANRFPDRVDGLVALSAGRTVRTGAYAKPSAGAALRALLGISLFHHARLIEYNRPGMAGRDDPLFNFRYSASFYSAVYGMRAGAVARMLRTGVIDCPNATIRGRRDLPLLVGVGDLDELFSAESARAFFDRLDSTPKEFVVLPGGHHATFPPGSSIPLVAWLRERFPERSPAPVVSGS